MTISVGDYVMGSSQYNAIAEGNRFTFGLFEGTDRSGYHLIDGKPYRYVYAIEERLAKIFLDNQKALTEIETLVNINGYLTLLDMLNIIAVVTVV